MSAKEDRELIATLESLGFDVERTSRNRIKALAPDGQLFFMSTQYDDARTKANQRAMLQRWQRQQAAGKPLTTEPVAQDVVNMLVWEGLLARHGQHVSAKELAAELDLDIIDVGNALLTLASQGRVWNRVVPSPRGNQKVYRAIPKENPMTETPTEEDPVIQVPIPQSLARAFQAFVDVIRQETGDTSAEAELYAEELARLETTIEDLHKKIRDRNDEIARLTTIERKYLRLTQAFQEE